MAARSETERSTVRKPADGTVEGHDGAERDGRVNEDRSPLPTAPFDRLIGRTRFVVLFGVAAVLLIAMALFVLGAGLAVVNVWQAFRGVLSGEMGTTDLTVELLEIVTVMLKAVVFYLVGVGLYSLFIAPLNVTTALGIETINDLETKVISIVIVIMAVTFLEHFITWQNPTEILQFGGTLALVVAALVLFQFHSHRARQDQKSSDPEQMRAQHRLFEHDEEGHDKRLAEPEATPGAAEHR